MNLLKYDPIKQLFINKIIIHFYRAHSNKYNEFFFTNINITFIMLLGIVYLLENNV